MVAITHNLSTVHRCRFRWAGGGPVLDKRGEVIGIAIAGFLGAQNLNYVIAVKHLKALLKTVQ